MGEYIFKVLCVNIDGLKYDLVLRLGLIYAPFADGNGCITANILPCFLDIFMNVREHIHYWAVQTSDINLIQLQM